MKGTMLLDAIRQVRALPGRYEALIIGTHGLIVLGVVPLLAWMLDTARSIASIPDLTDQNLFGLLLTPGSLLLVVVMSAIAITVTFFAYITMLAAADLQLDAQPASLRLLARHVVGTFRRLAHPESLLLVVQVVALAPFAGFTLFAPVSGAIALPPFIEREFMKTTLGAAGWNAVVVIMLYVLFRTFLVLPFTVVRRERPARAFLHGLTATNRGGGRFALLLVAAFAGALLASRLTVDAFAGAADALGAGTAASSVVQNCARVALAALTLAAGQLFAFLFVARARTASGLASAIISRRGSAASSISRRPIAVRAVVIAALMGAALVAPAAAASASTSATDASSAVVISHRGYDSGGVENTIGGLEAAIPFHPDYVEVDVQQTADGGFVASHDSNLLLLAGVNENIWDMTTDAVTATTITMKGHSDTIPTMREYVERAKQLGQPLLIEFKVSGHERPGWLAAAMQELGDVGPLDTNIYHSLDVDVVESIQHTYPGLQVGLTIAMLAGSLPTVDCDFYVIEQASLTPAMIAAAHAQGRPVYAWTVNTGLAMRTLLREGVDGIVTDDPASAERYRRSTTPGDPLSARDNLLESALTP